MSDMMTFPATVEEFMEQYKIVDDEKVYTNGADLVPIFRMMQWFEHVSATDTISRQAAIMDAESWVAVDEYEKNLQKKVVEWLKEFQPAELGTNLAEVGTDTISRQAAIEGKICVQRSNGVEIYDDYVVPVEYLEQLPPAQPERIKGRWIAKEKKNLFRCSKCDAVIYSESEYDRNEFYKFCGRCGAKMEVTDG